MRLQVNKEANDEFNGRIKARRYMPLNPVVMLKGRGKRMEETAGRQV